MMFDFNIETVSGEVGSRLWFVYFSDLNRMRIFVPQAGDFDYPEDLSDDDHCGHGVTYCSRCAICDEVSRGRDV